MAVDTYTLEQAEEDIAQLRGDVSQKEENLTITGQLTATGGTAGSPSLITTDTWHDTGALQSSWGKGSGYFKYQLLANGMVAVAAKDLNCSGATVTDGTTILSAANGLPTGYQPAANHTVPAYADVTRVASGSNNESAALKFVSDGSVQCLGIAAAATLVSCYAIIPIDI